MSSLQIAPLMQQPNHKEKSINIMERQPFYIRLNSSPLSSRLMHVEPPQMYAFVKQKYSEEGKSVLGKRNGERDREGGKGGAGRRVKGRLK